MKRYVYTTRRERFIVQILGFFAFPLVNIPLGIILWIISQQRINSQWSTLVLALPWLVNAIVIILAFLLHPEFGVGYIAFIGVAIGLGTALSVLFVAACFVTIPLAPIIGDQLAIGLFIVLILGGLAGLGALGIYVFLRWSSSYKNNSD